MPWAYDLCKLLMESLLTYPLNSFLASPPASTIETEVAVDACCAGACGESCNSWRGVAIRTFSRIPPRTPEVQLGSVAEAAPSDSFLEVTSIARVPAMVQKLAMAMDRPL